MITSRFAAAGVAAAALVSPSPAAALLTALPAEAASTRTLELRGGLTLRLPAEWRVYEVRSDWTRVVTGRCAKPKGSYFAPGCDGFWILGPKAIKVGHESFNPYTGKTPFYPATDVQLCPADRKWGLSFASAKPRVEGLRQVGPGHKAAYREWAVVCRSTTGKVKSRLTQREWYLPQTRILVVDQWNTPGLSGVLARARWR